MAEPALYPCPADGMTAEPALRALPKVLLHEHLDGCLRPSTLLQLLHARGLLSPAHDAAGLRRWFAQQTLSGNLVDYLRGFELTLAAMADAAAITRVAEEAALDAQADGCVLAEFRIAPLLLERAGLPAEAAIEALLEGLARCPLPSGLILCAMRQQPVADSLRVVELARRYRSQGVVGLDLAGPEAGHPAADHAQALAAAREAGLPLTLHAGEADGPQQVEQAVALGARRIGHGVRLAEWLDTPDGQERLRRLCDQRVHLEICPSSNVHTGAARSLPEHPIAALWRFGFSLSYHTDNPLMSATSMSQEAALLLRHQPLDRGDLLNMASQAARCSFLPAAQVEAATRRIEAAQGALAAQGAPLPAIPPAAPQAQLRAAPGGTQ